MVAVVCNELTVSHFVLPDDCLIARGELIILLRLEIFLLLVPFLVISVFEQILDIKVSVDGCIEDLCQSGTISASAQLSE